MQNSFRCSIFLQNNPDEGDTKHMFFDAVSKLYVAIDRRDAKDVGDAMRQAVNELLNENIRPSWLPCAGHVGSRMAGGVITSIDFDKREVTVKYDAE